MNGGTQGVKSFPSEEDGRQRTREMARGRAPAIERRWPKFTEGPPRRIQRFSADRQLDTSEAERVRETDVEILGARAWRSKKRERAMERERRNQWLK